MNKLFRLKEWFSLKDVARHLSTVLHSDVSEADVLEFGLLGHLTLSVKFSKGALVKRASIVRYSDAEMMAAINSETFPTDIRLVRIPRDIAAPLLLDPLWMDTIMLLSGRLEPERYLTFDQKLFYVAGIFDLLIVGGALREIHERYQKLIGDPTVTSEISEEMPVPTSLLMETEDGSLVQLQCSENHEALAIFRRLEVYRQNGGIPVSVATSLLEEHQEAGQALLELTEWKEWNNTLAAKRLPDGHVILVRKRALEKFIRDHVDGPEKARVPTRRACSPAKALLDRAEMRFWGDNVDPNDRSTIPKNADVAAWLVEQGLSASLAEKAASILRPDWAPVGRVRDE
jgi:hypothetical protein